MAAISHGVLIAESRIRDRRIPLDIQWHLSPPYLGWTFFMPEVIGKSLMSLLQSTMGRSLLLVDLPSCFSLFLLAASPLIYLPAADDARSSADIPR